MSDLKTNLAHSRMACSYLLNTLNVEGANWDQYRGSPKSYEACLQHASEKMCRQYKDTLDICVYDEVRPSFQRISGGKGILGQILALSSLVSSKKCGNCGEFAAAAFAYLIGKKVKPLEYCALDGADHAFVIIGRNDVDIRDYKKWGPAAVCDPWAQGFRGDKTSGTYAGVDFESNMKSLIPTFKGIKVFHREE